MTKMLNNGNISVFGEIYIYPVGFFTIMDDSQILVKLKSLIEEGNRLGKELHSYPYEYPSELHSNESIIQDCKKWKGSALNLIKLRFGEQSDFFQDLSSKLNTQYRDSGQFYGQKVREATGTLEYILDALESGLTEDIFFKKQLQLFSDFLEQAFEFLKEDFLLAAGIYGRIVLETTIREYAKKSNVSDSSFDQIIIKLRQKGIIHKPFENSLRANYEIGSWAAHNDKKFHDLKKSEIKEFLVFIRDKVLIL